MKKLFSLPTPMQQQPQSSETDQKVEKKNIFLRFGLCRRRVVQIWVEPWANFLVLWRSSSFVFQRTRGQFALTNGPTDKTGAAASQAGCR